MKKSFLLLLSILLFTSLSFSQYGGFAPNYDDVDGVGSDSLGFHEGVFHWLKIKSGSTFGKSLSSETFLNGFNGYGWKLDSSGQGYNFTVDNLLVRGRMRVYEFLAEQIRINNGALLISSTGKIKTIITYPTYYYITVEDSIRHGFLAGDIIRAKRFTGKDVYDSWLWIGYSYADTAFDAELLSGDPPAVGYEYGRVGSTTDSDRQGSIYETSSDVNAPYIDVKDGVTSVAGFSDPDNIKVRLGKIVLTDPYFGPIDTYGLYTTDGYFKGAFHSVRAYIGGWTVNDTAQYNTNTYLIASPTFQGLQSTKNFGGSYGIKPVIRVGNFIKDTIDIIDTVTTLGTWTTWKDGNYSGAWSAVTSLKERLAACSLTVQPDVPVATVTYTLTDPVVNKWYRVKWIDSGSSGWTGSGAVLYLDTILVYNGDGLKTYDSGWLYGNLDSIKAEIYTAADNGQTTLPVTEELVSIEVKRGQVFLDINLDGIRMYNTGSTALLEMSPFGITATGITSPNWVSQTNGYKISDNGNADFQHLTVKELSTKIFIADMEQALAGSQIISKSVAKVVEDFSIPIASKHNMLVVECFSGYPNVHVFADGDIIRLRQMTRSAGVTVADVWGTVVYQDGYDEQQYLFTRSAGANAGSASASTTISKGTLALDYGVSGDGYTETTTIDASGSPYMRVMVWTTHPCTGSVLKAQFGNLAGITDATLNPTGFGLYGENVFLKGIFTVVGGNVADTTTLATHINNNTTTINGGKITANSITASQIAANTITTSQINFTVPTNTNQLTNGAGFITGIDYGSISGTKPPAGADVTITAINGGLSLTGGGLTLASGGASLKGGQTAYNTGSGFWIGDVSGTTKFSLGNSSTKSLTWDGTDLTIANYTPYSDTVNAALHINSNSTTISGSKITTGSITALGIVTAGSFKGDSIVLGSNREFVVTKAGALTATSATITGTIQSGSTITGSTFQTSTSGARMVLATSNNGDIKFYDPDNVLIGYIYADPYPAAIQINASSHPIYLSGSTLTFNGNAVSISGHNHSGTYLPVSGAGNIYTHNAAEFAAAPTSGSFYLSVNPNGVAGNRMFISGLLYEFDGNDWVLYSN